MRTAFPRLARRPGPAPAAAVTALALVVSSLRAQEPPDSIPRDTARVTGEIVDMETRAPVPDAQVTLTLLGRPGGPGPVSADSVGEFAFPAVQAGRYLLRIVRFGYRDLSDTLRLVAHSETRVRVALVPAALDLEPLVVTAVRRTPFFMRGFDRRRRLGFGSFLDRDDIEERGAFVTTDLFRTLPGIRVISGPPGEGALLTMRARCRPHIYVDGVRSYEEVSLDLLLRPEDIEAVEVYSTGGVPAQFAGRGCGVILVWTRVPQPVMDGGSLWKRLAVVGGIVLGGLLLMR